MTHPEHSAKPDDRNHPPKLSANYHPVLFDGMKVGTVLEPGPIHEITGTPFRFWSSVRTVVVHEDGAHRLRLDPHIGFLGHFQFIGDVRRKGWLLGLHNYGDSSTSTVVYIGRPGVRYESPVAGHGHGFIPIDRSTMSGYEDTDLFIAVQGHGDWNIAIDSLAYET